MLLNGGSWGLHKFMILCSLGRGKRKLVRSTFSGARDSNPSASALRGGESGTRNFETRLSGLGGNSDALRVLWPLRCASCLSSCFHLSGVDTPVFGGVVVLGSRFFVLLCFDFTFFWVFLFWPLCLF